MFLFLKSLINSHNIHIKNKFTKQTESGEGSIVFYS